MTGGKFDLKTDGSLDWLTVFLDKIDSDLILNKTNNNGNKININEDFNQNLYKFFKPHLINQNSLGNTLVDFKMRDLNSLPFEISLRICAIRETFEETGLLLAKKKSNINVNNKESNLTTNFIDNNNNGYDFKYWLNKIKNDSKEFLNMCLEYNLVPDIYGLHEWANWITPNIEKYRFNTVFFTCFLSHLPSSEKFIISNEEISKLEVFIY